MKSFRLRSLRIKDHEVFKNEIDFVFFSNFNNLSIDKPSFSLILGPNGTGKSNLLKIIIEIFRIAYEKKIDAKQINYPSGKYFLEYQLGDNNYTILNTLGWEFGKGKPQDIEDDKGEKGIRFFRNGTEIEPTEIDLPQSILALSIMLTDKYLFLKDPNTYPIYKYLGARKDNNSAGTRSFIAKTIDHIFTASGKKEFITNLKEVLTFLELGNEFNISYSPRYKHHFFSKDLTIEKFEDFFLNNKIYLPKRATEPWSITQFKKLKESEPLVIPKLVSLLNYLANNLENYENSRAQYFEFNIFDLGTDIQELFPLLPYLHGLDIISYPEITLRKEGHYSIGQSSSGEYHFISTIVGLLATITDNSLILIDEPEISLHPNWQMKYIAFLSKVFKKYNSTHFLICSHSHFLVSDLEAENSSIIALKRDSISHNLSAELLIGQNTYGWSAEEILYNVFKVKTVRNHFLEADLTDLLGMISENSKEKNKIQKLLSTIQSIKISVNDPLNAVIEEANAYLKTI